MTSFARITFAGLASLLLAGSAEALPIATPSVPATPVVHTALVVTKVVRRRPIVRVVRPRPRVIVKKIIR